MRRAVENDEELRNVLDAKPFVRKALELLQPDAKLTWAELGEGTNTQTGVMRGAFISITHECFFKHLGLECDGKGVRWPMPLGFRKQKCSV